MFWIQCIIFLFPENTCLNYVYAQLSFNRCVKSRWILIPIVRNWLGSSYLKTFANIDRLIGNKVKHDDTPSYDAWLTHSLIQMFFRYSGRLFRIIKTELYGPLYSQVRSFDAHIRNFSDQIQQHIFLIMIQMKWTVNPYRCVVATYWYDRFISYLVPAVTRHSLHVTVCHNRHLEHKDQIMRDELLPIRAYATRGRWYDDAMNMEAFTLS